MYRIKPLIVLLIIQSFSVLGQTLHQETDLSSDEITYLQQIVEKMAINDQKYRKYIGHETLDDNIITKIDSVFENHGMQESISYEESLNLSLSKEVSDSLWRLQHQLDFENHLLLRGMLNAYGYLPKSILKDKHYIQVLLLLHPPKDWDVRLYQKTYSELFLREVKEGRMSAKSFANFYDNMQAKILREPQLYGTNQQFDPETNSILPPMIKSIEETNNARKEIGLPPLKEGEYRIFE